jgi:hypothetical protein
VHNFFSEICIHSLYNRVILKSSKESTEAVSLLKTGNKVVEVG